MPFMPTGWVPSPRRVTSFPVSPIEGTQVRIPDVGTFIYTQGRWVGTSGSDVVLPYAVGVAVQKAVTAVGGEVVLTNRAVHLQSTGVVLAIVDSFAVVRRDGIVPGFVGLSDGDRLFVGSDPGSIQVGGLAPSSRIIPIGWAMPAGEIMVHLYEPKGT